MARLALAGLACLALAGLAAACSGDNRSPSRLLDGSPAEKPPVDLEGVAGPVVLTRISAARLPRARLGSSTAACLQGPARGRRAVRALERVGVAARSVTVADAGPRTLVACDESAGPREPEGQWCGSAFAVLRAGRLPDPRLDVLCRTAEDEPIAFAWVEPASGARYLVVEQPGYAEAYRVVAGLPVRVATVADVSLEGFARFSLSEHDARGRQLRRYVLDARVAG
ncbi:MAG TPA: hypothetical protein VNJ53_06840 [Gaiellaceae bacterium]|nr:hypothetical protein [Gaiellaceae bacterium]